ncbi:diacylglycerol/lipid kinase family protein [Robertmurraya kyonggiensis]|uniref:Diacylglycerol kinase family lipid kinase n=1 Tax=Robertmurraya kyonggiensis TaxID=1037680 RepID=A0A4U1D1C1_9BACI|nr:diacylglycerol kinase family protein [Robertmurraya kyonggiensis]TKC15864.1 diacylglycerol kinase family lipid kinase [Robertmurraya kyonggiensis]
MKNLYVIINPQAKNGYSKKVWLDVEKELQSRQIPYTAFNTEYPGHARELARSICKETKHEDKAVIVVIGGDGTLHEVINGTVGAKNVSVGFIPGGSGNDFSRGYGIPKNHLSASNFLLKQIDLQPILVDVGEIVHSEEKTTYFVNNMGAGFDALITKEANHSKLKKVMNRFSLGNLIYAYFVLKKLFTFKRTVVNMTIDGKKYKFEETWFVTVSNQPYYGGGMKISPKASVRDGLLNVTVVQNLSRMKFLFVFITVFWGGHERMKEVKNFLGKEIFIESKDPLFVHADGEFIGETPVSIQACPQVLPLVTREIDK